MTAHSHIGASSAYRWMKCPASAKLSVGIKSESSEFAKEGTAAHELAEMCILENKNPLALIGTSIKVEKDIFVVDEDMAKHIAGFLIRSYDYLDDNKNRKIHAEKKVNLDWLTYGMFGTCDITIDGDPEVLIIRDLKYGAGKPVYAENNPQIMYYALAALGKPRGGLPKRIRMDIDQPRCEYSGTTSWEILTEELYDWAYNELLPAVNATRVDNPKFQLGEYCTWCPVFSTCPHLAEIASGVLGVDVTLPVQSQNLVLPKPEVLTTEQKIRIVEFMELATPWLKSVQEAVFKDAISGNIIPGYKLVQKRLGNRRWVNTDSVIELYGKDYGDEIFEPRKLISPANMEKLLGGGKVVKDELDKLTERPDTGLELKPESDKRQAVIPQNRVVEALDAEYGSVL